MGPRQGPPGSLAARVTYLLEPANWLIVTMIAVGAYAGGLTGAGWGLLAAFFAAVLPATFISWGIRRGRREDRNVGARRPRLIMLASVAALAAITVVWKISIHCAVAAGSVTILALLYGPPALAGFLLVGLLGWSRVALRDHTAAQVIGGTVLGAAAAALAYSVL